MTTIPEADDMAPNFVQVWMQQDAGIAPDPEPEPEPEPSPTDAFGEYVAPVVDRQTPARRAAILAAVGVDAAEPNTTRESYLPPDVSECFPAHDYDPASPPQPVPAPVQVAELPTEPPAGVPGQAERHARTWRERVGLPRRKEKLSPVHTTAGRRERYARDKAARTGMSFDEAMASIVQRPETTRYGRRKAIAEARAEAAQAGALTDGTSLDA